MSHFFRLVLVAFIYALSAFGAGGIEGTCTLFGPDGSCFSGMMQGSSSGCCGAGLFKTSSSLFEGALSYTCNDKTGATFFGGYESASMQSTCNLCYQAGRLDSASFSAATQSLDVRYSMWTPEDGVEQHQASGALRYKTLYVDSTYSSQAGAKIHALFNASTQKFECGYAGKSLMASFDGAMANLTCEVPLDGNSIHLKGGVTAMGAMSQCRLRGGVQGGSKSIDLDISGIVRGNCPFNASFQYMTGANPLFPTAPSGSSTYGCLFEILKY